MPVSPENNIYDRILDMIPVAIDKLVEGVETLKKNGKEKTEGKDSVTSELTSGTATDF